MSKGSGILSLLDLPPEIRNMIYELLLPLGAVTIVDGRYTEDTYISRWSSDRKSCSERYIFSNAQVCRGSQFKDGSDASWPLESASYRGLTRLLCTNRQVREEAANYAYGAVTFKIAAEKPALEALRAMGVMKRRIRSVHLLHVRLDFYQSILHQLKEARYFQRLTIEPSIRLHYCLNRPGSYRNLWNAERLAATLAPFAKTLARAWGDRCTRERILQTFCVIDRNFNLSDPGIDPSLFSFLKEPFRRANNAEGDLRGKLDEMLC